MFGYVPQRWDMLCAALVKDGVTIMAADGSPDVKAKLDLGLNAKEIVLEACEAFGKVRGEVIQKISATRKIIAKVKAGLYKENDTLLRDGKPFAHVYNVAPGWVALKLENGEVEKWLPGDLAEDIESGAITMEPYKPAGKVKADGEAFQEVTGKEPIKVVDLVTGGESFHTEKKDAYKMAWIIQNKLGHNYRIEFRDDKSTVTSKLKAEAEKTVIPHTREDGVDVCILCGKPSPVSAQYCGGKECLAEKVKGAQHPPKCDQCDSAYINGLYCHEHGCPNRNKYYDFETEEWVREQDEDMDFEASKKVNAKEVKAGVPTKPQPGPAPTGQAWAWSDEKQDWYLQALSVAPGAQPASPSASPNMNPPGVSY
jgi:hypothetical protein